jgi:hypothetical protein
MLTLGLLQISLAAKAQRTEGHLLRGNEVWKVLKSLKFLFGNLIPTVSNKEGQVINNNNNNNNNNNDNIEI